MSAKLRVTEVLIFCAYTAFVVAGTGFKKMTEYADFAAAARVHVAVGGAFNTVVISSLVALLAILVGGLPITLAALRQALAERRGDVLALFATPPLTLLTLLGLTWLFNSVPLLAAQPPALAGLVYFGAWAIGAAVCAAAISTAILRSNVRESLFTFARVPALLATLAMVAMLLGTLVWGLSLSAVAPALFYGNDGILGSQTWICWLVILLVMALATSVAASALRRCFGPGADAGVLA